MDEISRNILKDYKGDDWKQYVKVDNKRYCRNKIIENDNFEIFIISWNKNQNAPLELYESNCMKTNDVSFMKNDIGYHSILNESDEIAITFQVYNPPNHKTKFFLVFINNK